jgi:hypothetical protein
VPPRKSFPLRISPELYDELRRWAEQDFRSVNGQIEFLLRDAVRRRKGDIIDPPESSTK